MLYATHTGISSSSSSTSSFVTTIVSKPLIAAEYRSTGVSNHPHRRGRPVTLPNSCPRLRISSPAAPSASVGNGPPPTRVVYVFEIPITASIFVGGTPLPIQAPPADELDDVTKG